KTSRILIRWWLARAGAARSASATPVAKPSESPRRCHGRCGAFPIAFPITLTYVARRRGDCAEAPGLIPLGSAADDPEARHCGRGVGAAVGVQRPDPERVAAEAQAPERERRLAGPEHVVVDPALERRSTRRVRHEPEGRG